jgi:hypothetical protein
VTIADDHQPVAMPAPAEVMAETRAATVELDAIDPDDAGRSEYRGPLLADLQLRVGGDTGAGADGAWPAMLDADHLGPLDAIVRAVDDRLRCEALSDRSGELTVEVVTEETRAPEAEEVALTRISTGTDFVFENRGTPVEIRRG